MKKPKRKVVIIVLISFVLGVAAMIGFNGVMSETSKSEYCISCHIHPEADNSWKQSMHFKSKSGVKTECVECHLPPKGTFKHTKEKIRLGLKDFWSYITKDSASINWEEKRTLEAASKYVFNESCEKCHVSLYPSRLSQDGLTAHLYYEENKTKLDLQCISCHMDAGHHNPKLSHSRMQGIPTTSSGSGVIYTEPSQVTSFENFTEYIPGTPISFEMKAIPGGTFKMGSPDKEPFRKEDESPVRYVTLSKFFMAEIEVTWDQYFAFYKETMSEARTKPEAVYANNVTDPEADAISGPTPPFGIPDQGWGAGNRPAITMTYYGAQTFCQWLSKKTGKKYRIPTEAEWEYAARGGTETPYFFEGDPKKFSNQGFWRKIFSADTAMIASYAVYDNNSRMMTQEPSFVKANPFGLKNMYGNAMEYCADMYNPKAYSKTPAQVTNPIETEGDEHVVRGGDFRSDAADLRSAARGKTDHVAWLKTDPQQPKSIWWYSDIKSIGFRVVCEWEEK